MFAFEIHRPAQHGRQGGKVMSEGTGKAGPGGARALEHLCRQHLAWERNSDTTDFQRRARLLQALWREASNLPVGTLKGLPRGAMLEMPFAQECLANYLTPTIRGVVEREVLDRKRSKGKVFGRPRIFANLLSSQPLCFNLFGEMAEDLDLATAVLRDLTGGAVARVLGIEFEHSPGRGDTTYTGDRSAFDVFIQYEPARGGRQVSLGSEGGVASGSRSSTTRASGTRKLRTGTATTRSRQLWACSAPIAFEISSADPWSRSGGTTC